MSVVTDGLYDKLAGDATMVGLLSSYEGNPAIFTMDPAPGDAELPYIVSAGEVSQAPFDTKTTRGRDLIRDVRCYAAADGSTVLVEAIAERARALLHRQELVIDGFRWLISDCTGPIVADEPDTYGRIISLSLKIQED
jgi:hypothetical protein